MIKAQEYCSMSRARLVACVLLPFAAGYFLSYLFRTINAVIAGNLSAELDLSAADLGLLTSVYFLVFAAAQLPLGALLDRFGPSLVQSVLMLVASAGALTFAWADGLVGLAIGRALIGLGVAVALMAGIKAIVTWFPPHRSGVATGLLVTLGALGGLTATGPAELLVQQVGWRGLFVVLAGLSAIAALLLLFAAPDWAPSRTPPRATASFSMIYRDARFWRIAPLAAVGVGTSWSLQGLWAAPWLQDVEGLERSIIVQYLGLMALAVCASALLLGSATDRLRRVGIKAESLLVATLGLSMLAQAALILRWPLPPLLPWMIICAAGAATVLSYALLSEYFPKAMSARANGALNVMNVGSAFVLQAAAGFIIELWPKTNGSYPAEAHQAAMAVPLVLQLAALGWFALPRRRTALSMHDIATQAGGVSRARPAVTLHGGFPHMERPGAHRTPAGGPLANGSDRIDVALNCARSADGLGRQPREIPATDRAETLKCSRHDDPAAFLADEHHRRFRSYVVSRGCGRSRHEAISQQPTGELTCGKA